MFNLTLLKVRVILLLLLSFKISYTETRDSKVFETLILKVTFFIIIITVINIALYWIFLVTITLLNYIIVKTLSL